VITDRNVLDTLQLHLSTSTRLYVSHFFFLFFESIFFPKDKPETRAVSHLSDLFVSIHHRLTLSHNLSYSCPALGAGIPVGKDSMSMAMRWRDSQSGDSVTAPLSLIVTAFAGVEDVGATWTPQLRTDLNGPTVLVFFDLACWKQRLGGSALAQVFRQIGAEVPDVEDPHLLKAFFNACQAVRKSDPDLVLAYHDRSDGGLFTTVAEMAFAGLGRVGVEVNLDAILTQCTRRRPG
jgi:phosphoribosylformylglycinamidine (FGAM) synthase-like enzyme